VLEDPLEFRLRDLLPALPETVVTVYLFGSAARGEAKPGSDVDLAFWRRERSASTLAEQPYALAAKLEEALGREVDLVELTARPRIFFTKF
jgi:predicted nucleotidyltransferase